MTGRNVRKYQAELVSLRSNLLSKMFKNAEALNSFEEGDIADQATGYYLQEMQSCTDQWNHQRLALVEAALERIESRTYGKCEECGESIGRKRLVAVPWARLCLRCKLAEEQQ